MKLRDIRYSFYLVILLRKQSNYLSYPQHYGGHRNDDDPIDELQRDNIEHLTAKLDNQYLSQDDAQNDEAKALAVLEMECTATCLKGSGIEHVPKLYHDKDGEE